MTVNYQSPREEEVMKWADKNVTPRVKPIVDALTREFIGPVSQTRPLPGPIEALRAWCATRGILKGFWQTM